MNLKIFYVLQTLIFPGQFLFSQSCYQNRLKDATELYNKGQYNSSRSVLEVAKKCSDANITGLNDWIRKCDIKIEEQRRIAEGNNIPKGKELSVVDSLKRIVALKYKWGHGEGNENTQLRYINACNSLGDYYLRAKNTSAAVFYYKKVTDLTAGTDSDLGENMAAVKLWNKSRIKLAELYRERPLLEKDKNKILGLIDENRDLTMELLGEFSAYLYGKDAILLSKPGSYTLKDSLALEYLINPLYINLLRTRDFSLPINLENVAGYLRNNPEKNMTIYTTLYKMTMITQARAYEMPMRIINDLIEHYGISADRLSYQSLDITPDYLSEYNGVKVYSVMFVFGTAGN